MAGEIVIRQLIQQENPALYSQVLHLRNQLLRVPIGLDLFQEDLSQESNHVTLAALTTVKPKLAKSNDNTTDNSKEIDTQNGEKMSKNEGGSGTVGTTETSCNEETVIGCILLAPCPVDKAAFKIRQMAISPEFQGKGIGSKLVDSAEDFAKQMGKSRLHLNGRKPAVGFYLKKGFRKIREEEFLELGIPHYALEKNLLF